LFVEPQPREPAPEAGAASVVVAQLPELYRDPERFKAAAWIPAMSGVSAGGKVAAIWPQHSRDDAPSTRLMPSVAAASFLMQSFTGLTSGTE